MIEFKTHNDLNFDVSGGYLDYIKISYDKLLRTFGAPHQGVENKIDAKWKILFRDGRIATIYNWKNGKSYLGRKGLSLENIESWNIGGRDKSVVRVIEDILKNSSFRLSNLKKYDNLINAPTQDNWEIMLDCLEKYCDRTEQKYNGGMISIEVLDKLKNSLIDIPEIATEAFK